MKKSKLAFAAGVAALALTLVSTTPAFAEERSGSKNCTSTNQQGQVAAQSAIASSHVRWRNTSTSNFYKYNSSAAGAYVYSSSDQNSARYTATTAPTTQVFNYFSVSCIPF